ncbi:MAG TPA: O-antigen ligase family protein [Planctomycetaceae bacterium]|nr:O-antigen ligase family protein [Planctomycetaceae bacterium]
MSHPLIATLTFLLFQLTTATLFLRPAEMFDWLADVPLYEGLILSTLVLSAFSLEPHFHVRAMYRQPITFCVIGVFVAIILSQLTHAYLGGVRDSATEFSKTLLYYGLVITAVNSPTRMRWFLANLGICCGLMVTLCLLDYWKVVDLEFIVHLQDLDGFDDEGEPIWFERMRGTGIFQDPNDLAMVIVAAGCLCLYFLTDKTLGIWRGLWALPIGVFAIAILETKSRGGLLAGAAAVMAMASLRYGTKVAVVFAVLGGCMLPIVAGRSGNIEFSEGSTSEERLLMWREGFDAIKSPEILFGIGHGTYADLAGLVAHNSFVHTYVELGLFGGTLFLGCFFVAAVQIYRIGQQPQEVFHTELLRMRPYVAGVMAGWCMSMVSLSRCYVVPTFMVLGMQAAYLNLVWIHTYSGKPLLIWDRWECFRLTTVSACVFTGLYVFTMVMT